MLERMSGERTTKRKTTDSKTLRMELLKTKERASSTDDTVSHTLLTFTCAHGTVRHLSCARGSQDACCSHQFCLPHAQHLRMMPCPDIGPLGARNIPGIVAGCAP